MRCENTTAGTLDLEVEMAGTAGIKRRDDGVESPPSLCVRELVAAQAETDTVVVAVFVRMPDLDEAAGEGAAAIVEDEAGDGDPFATGRVGIEIAFERRVRPEKRIGFPFEGDLVAVVT